MLIKDLHKDIERYLLNDCYCQHEIYSFDGFGYQLFYEDQECKKLGEIHVKDTDLVCCTALPFNDVKNKPQVVIFFLDGDKCVDALRYDATENNLSITKDILANGINGRKFNFDEYEPGATVKSLDEIL
ncbi:MAG: hypothetical protein PHI22_04645, partial [Bacilli bacterium]|nr:hypothetical protein [Bacilli bacterium]